MAVRDARGDLVMSSHRVGRRARDIWLRSNGLDHSTTWKVHREREGLEAVLQCDALSCVYRPPHRPELDIALVNSPLALAEDCSRAHILIASVPARRCRGPTTIIDRFDLWREGPHAIWLINKGAVVKTAAQDQGIRPWAHLPASVVQKRPKRQRY